VILRIKGIKKARAKGRIYYYHRKTMTRLPGDPGSTEFIAKLRELEIPKSSGPKSGTLGALIAAYKQAPEYTELAPGSKREYGKAIGHLRSFDGVPLAVITDVRLYELRDRLMVRTAALPPTGRFYSCGWSSLGASNGTSATQTLP
jgi:hypothetical protein